MAESIKVDLDTGASVTALIYRAASARTLGSTIILGHGAGAGQLSGFMVKFAAGLAERGLDAVTFNFSYTEQGRRVPDPGPRLEACYRSVIQAVTAQPALASNHLIIGGKSMGGRIASQVAAQGLEARFNLAGLILLGYPLHPPGKPDQLRDKHLPKIKSRMLFVQGSRDTFGTPEELEKVFKVIGPNATLFVVEDGDHSFKVPKKHIPAQEEIYSDVMDRIAGFAV
ncbi:MAG: alpha/beta hydrolase family protein [Blastocatellia bacterium]